MREKIHGAHEGKCPDHYVEDGFADRLLQGFGQARVLSRGDRIGVGRIDLDNSRDLTAKPAGEEAAERKIDHTSDAVRG